MSAFISLVVAITMVSACGDSAVNIQPIQQPVVYADTIVIAASVRPDTLDKQRPLLQFTLTNGSAASGNGRYFLVLADVVMKFPPEGVYELYFTTDKKSSMNLMPEDEHFIQVIDTYMLNNSAANQRLMYDVTRHVKSLMALKNNPIFYVSILFRGNLPANKKASENAGTLTVGSISLLEIR